jgi:uncharacterized protein YxeA
MKMVIIFIVILVVVGIIAVWFNIWNIRNPVGKSNKPNITIQNDIENIRYMDQHNKEQNERILKMFDNKGAV